MSKEMDWEKQIDDMTKTDWIDKLRELTKRGGRKRCMADLQSPKRMMILTLLDTLDFCEEAIEKNEFSKSQAKNIQTSIRETLNLIKMTQMKNYVW